MCNLLPVVNLLSWRYGKFTFLLGKGQLPNTGCLQFPPSQLLNFSSLLLQCSWVQSFFLIAIISWVRFDFVKCYTLTMLLDKVMGRTWPLVDPRVGPRQWKAPQPLPRPCSHSGSCLTNAALREQTYCWEHLDGMCDWRPLKSLYKLKVLEGRWGDQLLMQLSKTSLICKFCCILDGPPTNLEWPASTFFSPCPPCPGTSLRFHLGKSWGFEPTIVWKYFSSNFWKSPMTPWLHCL